jgi:hypothetical protein
LPIPVFQYGDERQAGNVAIFHVYVTWNKMLMATREKGINYLVLGSGNKEWKYGKSICLIQKDIREWLNKLFKEYGIAICFESR